MSSMPDLEEPILNLFFANNYSGAIKAIRSIFPIDPPEKIKLLYAYCEFVIGNFKESYTHFSNYLKEYNYNQAVYLWFELSQFLYNINFCQSISKDYIKSICKIVTHYSSFVLSLSKSNQEEILYVVFALNYIVSQGLLDRKEIYPKVLIKACIQVLTHKCKGIIHKHKMTAHSKVGTYLRLALFGKYIDQITEEHLWEIFIRLIASKNRTMYVEDIPFLKLLYNILNSKLKKSEHDSIFVYQRVVIALYPYLGEKTSKEYFEAGSMNSWLKCAKDYFNQVINRLIQRNSLVSNAIQRIKRHGDIQKAVDICNYLIKGYNKIWTYADNDLLEFFEVCHVIFQIELKVPPDELLINKIKNSEKATALFKSLTMHSS